MYVIPTPSAPHPTQNTQRNKWHGHGKYTSPDGASSYEGGFRGGRRHGTGVEIGCVRGWVGVGWMESPGACFPFPP